MTQDLISIRGLTDGFETPVRSFDGIFGEYGSKGAGNFGGSIVSVSFKEIDNVVAISPYNLVTVTLEMWLNNKHKSEWGYFGDSLAELILPDEDIKDCIERRMSLVFCDGKDDRPAPKPIWRKEPPADLLEKYPDKMIPTAVWIVTAVEGVGAGPTGLAEGVSAADWAEQNLTGSATGPGASKGPMTRADFNKWAFADPQVRKDTSLQRSITDKSFINSLLQLERVVEDGDGVFQLPG